MTTFGTTASANIRVNVCKQQRRPLFSWLNHVVLISNQRQDLGRLDDTRLEDLGLSRSDASHEANRPFWDVPDYWLR